MRTLRRWLVRWLRVVLAWLDPDAWPSPAVQMAAHLIVRQAAKSPHTVHFKRAVAMKALQQTFPAVRRRELSMAIELAVKDLP